jgi:hypothetical protein
MAVVGGRVGKAPVGTNGREMEVPGHYERGGGSMRTYERPTLTMAGSFKRATGVGGHGPKDVLVKHQML